MKATERINETIWTIEYEEISSSEVRVLRYTPRDMEGYKKEKNLPQCHIIENEDRKIIGLLIRDNYNEFKQVNAENCDHSYLVVNPKNVFQYTGM